MIQLPKDFTLQARVDTRTPAIVLHYKNKADEYFTVYVVIDLAMQLDDQLERLKGYDLSQAKAYKLHPDLRTEFLSPTDQEWSPAPVPGDSVLSVEQYKVQLKQLAHNRQESMNSGQ